MYELSCRYDSRKSFYGKAIVNFEGEKQVLYSYGTRVCEIVGEEIKIFRIL